MEVCSYTKRGLTLLNTYILNLTANMLQFHHIIELHILELLNLFTSVHDILTLETQRRLLKLKLKIIALLETLGCHKLI
jgi:predicted transposase YbfD/YdcC